MNAKEAVEYLNHHSWSAMKLGLQRTRELLRRVGNPQDHLRFVHVAGTNGKGSTCAMIERILREAGYRTGLYPSPFIEEFSERIQVAGENIRDEALGRLTGIVAEAAEAMEEHPTHFELITAVGMLYFLEEHCDIVVLEVGMGGEFDSTNVILPPDVAVITNIGLDHTEYLGDTVEKIAATKAGIIKPGSDVVVYENLPSVTAVIEEKCRKEGCPLHYAKDLVTKPGETGLSGQKFTWDGREYRLSLLGKHQLANTRVVLSVIRVLRKRGWNISDEAVERGLSLVTWPARFEVLSQDPVFILDGGHNPQCAEALAEALREYLPGEKVTFLIGMLRDKDYRTVLRTIAPFGEHYVTVTPDSPRALPAAELAGELQSAGYGAEALDSGKPTEETIISAIRTARRKDLPVVAFGSLYTAGLIRSNFRKHFT